MSGAGIIRASEYCLLECESQMEEVVQHVGSGWFGLHNRGVLPDKLFTLSRG